MYIVIYESRHYGQIAYETTLKESNRLLKSENEVFYIFKNNIKTKLFNIKLNFLFYEYYNCLSINKLPEKIEEDNDYIIISKNETCQDGCLCLTH